MSGQLRLVVAAADDLAAADQAMVALSNRDEAAGVRDETPEFYAANDRARAAYAAVPWWARWWASRRSYRRIEWSAK